MDLFLRPTWRACSLLYIIPCHRREGAAADPLAVEEKMAAPDIVWKGGRFGRTSRRDPWWLSPSAVLLGLSAFLIYSTWAAWQGNYYTFGPYISPFYSPELFGSSPHALFGPKPSWYPSFLPFSPCGSPASSGSRVTTTAARTTSRSGQILLRARSANRAKAISASEPFL